jgi:prepilin-type N-terminal cleavage/methylation domain-containing protein
MTGRGFTVVELIITITIMGILLLLTVVNVNASQVAARDTERVSDIEAFALNLESFYRIGRDNSTTFGRYPSTGLTTPDASSIQLNLRDIDLDSVKAPGIDDPLDTLLMATNNVQTTAGVLPQPTISQYIYQPLQPDGSLCTSGSQDCRKYNLYYRLEKDNTVYMLTSKNQ